MSKLDESISEVITKLSQIVDSNSAQAAELGGRVIQLSTLTDMITGPIELVSAGVCSFIAYKLWKKYYKLEDENGKYYSSENESWAIWACIITIISSFTALIGSLMTIKYIFNPLNWAILSDYKLAIASKLIAKFLD